MELYVSEAAEIEQRMARHKELEDEARQLKGDLRANEKKQEELVAAAREKFGRADARSVIVDRLHRLLVQTYEGYLLRMVKERYKDDSLNIADAGEKVKALINKHLIDLGINPRIPTIELLSPDFMEHLEKHSGGDPEGKASEMEHAIRKHCAVHFDEDPAFYARLSDKLEKLIQE